MGLWDRVRSRPRVCVCGVVVGSDPSAGTSRRPCIALTEPRGRVAGRLSLGYERTHDRRRSAWSTRVHPRYRAAGNRNWSSSLFGVKRAPFAKFFLASEDFFVKLFASFENPFVSSEHFGGGAENFFVKLFASKDCFCKTICVF